jgi:hypothetical protein
METMTATNKGNTSSLSGSFNGANTDPQFIFQEDEFEGVEFNPTQFVAKYRRVTSLESLKDQLREYSQSLKNQVFLSFVVPPLYSRLLNTTFSYPFQVVCDNQSRL